MVLLKISRYPTPGSIRENLDIQLLVLLETSRIDILILVLLEQMSSSISLCTLKVYVEVYVAVNVSFTAPYSWFGFFPQTYLINLSRTLFNSACIWNFTSLKKQAFGRIFRGFGYSSWWTVISWPCWNFFLSLVNLTFIKKLHSKCNNMKNEKYISTMIFILLSTYTNAIFKPKLINFLPRQSPFRIQLKLKNEKFWLKF